MPSLSPPQLPLIIGHRGAATYAPENTLAGIREAGRRGAEWVEVDVKLTRDGVLILMHDENLKRTGGLDRKVAETDAAQIAALDAGGWFGPAFAGERVPTFEQFVALLDELGMGSNIEIKACPGREAETAIATVEALERLWPARLPTPLLSSFKDEALAAARERAPHYPRAVLIDELKPGWHERAAAVGATVVNTNGHRLSEDGARAIKAAGFGLGLYTINEGPLAHTLRRWGGDTIITDSPDVVRAAL